MFFQLIRTDAGEDEKKQKEMRAVYNNLLKKVGALLGDEVSTEELHSATYLIYDTLRTDKSDSEKRYL